MVMITYKIKLTNGYYKRKDQILQGRKNISVVQNTNIHYIKALAGVLTVVLEENDGNDTG